MKKEEIVVNIISQQPKKVGYLISEGNILLGLKTEDILGRNIGPVFFLRLVAGNLSQLFQVKKVLEREVSSKPLMET